MGVYIGDVFQAGADSLHINSAATTLVKSGLGVLGSIVVNSPSDSAVTVYDSITGSGTILAGIMTGTFNGTLAYNIKFTNGLTIVTNGTSDITVTYR